MAKSKLTYKEAFSEIETIIQKIEANEFDIDELSQQVKRVSELIKLCKDKLHKTESEVENILDDIQTNLNE